MKNKIPGYAGRAVFLAGFFMIAGGIGHMDMMAEMQAVLPAMEALSSLFISVLGFPVAAMGYRLIQKYDTGM